MALGKVLKFHVVPSVVSGRGLCDGRELDTLDSSKTISIKDYSSVSRTLFAPFVSGRHCNMTLSKAISSQVLLYLLTVCMNLTNDID